MYIGSCLSALSSAISKNALTIRRSANFFARPNVADSFEQFFPINPAPFRYSLCQ
jgi:hypothetical protein